jgi:hypothetical protein
MTNTRPSEYWQEQFGKTQPHKLEFIFGITAAKTVSLKPQGLGAVLSFFDAITQAQIDAALESTNEFTAAKFDATSMGADAFGLIVNCAKQIQKLVAAKAVCYSGTDGQTVVQTATITPLADTTLASQASVSSLGNIGAKFNFGNTPDFDALTAGIIVVTFDVIFK